MDRAVIQSTSIALVSSVIVFGLLGLVVVNAPGWPEVRNYFLNPQWFNYSLPKIVDAFGVNVRLFLIAEVLILVLAMVIAVMRSLPGPVFFPLRLLATIYADIFRQNPEGLSYQDNLSAETAQDLQKAAADTVFNGQWGIP